MPGPTYWKSRDLFAEIHWMARRGCIEVVPVPETVGTVKDFSLVGSGWKSYGFRVPAGEKLHVRLHHSNEGWFRLQMVNKWGNLEEGMLKNLIPTGNPEVTYTNPSKETRNVYVIVDDPGWMSSKENPYTLAIERSWDPAKTPVDNNKVPIAVGIWAEKKSISADQKG